MSLVGTGRASLFLAGLAAAWAVAAALSTERADAAVGDLSYLDCITSAVSTDDSCSGSILPLHRIEYTIDAVVSPDGKSVYTASELHDNVSHFTRNPSTGALSFVACHSGKNPNANSCAATADATVGGGNSGLDQPWVLAVSPDGKSLYVASRLDDSIAHFSRNTNTGALAYVDCISSEVDSAGCVQAPGGLGNPLDVEVAPSGNAVYVASLDDDVVTTLRRNTSTGALTYLEQSGEGIDAARSVAISPDSRSVYVASGNNDAVSAFDATVGTGALTPLGCITAESGEDDCVEVPGATFSGDDSGLATPTSIVVSPDGGSVYVTAQGDHAVARFSRLTTEMDFGEIAYAGCVSGATTDGAGPPIPCTQAPGAGLNAQFTGMQNIEDLAIAPDGESLHVVSDVDDAVTTLSPSLAHRGCISGRTQSTIGNGGQCVAIPTATSGGDESGLDDLEAIAISPDGTSAYTPAHDDDAIGIFSREADLTPDTTVEFSSKAKRKQKGTTVKVSVTCEEDCTVKGSGKATAKPKGKGKKGKKVKAKLKPAQRALAAGESTTLKLKATGKAKKKLKKALKRGAKATAKATLKISDAAGNVKSKSFQVKLK